MRTFEELEASKLSKLKNEERDQYIWVDVRTEEEYAEGHIPNTIHIPHDEVEARVTELESYKEKELILVCRSGRRSEYAAEILAEKGFKNLYNFKGGMLEWTGPVKHK
ncbi:rhodanese-like domain-containing protein [Polycladospora coralii]|nr:rhodanese-like domain-containing protein [Polycladospora coralii]